ncbi:MAG: deoxyhypusine synthase family protein [Candidatus Eisenbacteria bacterium]|nr:deoxyhypusine synthase family protein [Candidatus Eisenbacteria bacterium]
MEPKNPALSQLVRTSFEPEEAERILSGFLAFTAEAMDVNTTVGLSLAGPFAATGHRLDGLAPLLEGGFVDWVVARGEDLYLDAETGFEHAIRNTEGSELAEGSPGSTRPDPSRGASAADQGEGSPHTAVPDTAGPRSAAAAGSTESGGAASAAAGSATTSESRASERVRIGDQIFHRNQVLSTEEFLGRLVVTPPFQKTLATTELNNLLGRFLGERDRVFGLTAPTSVLAIAHKHKIPVFSDTPGGSVVGRRIAAAALSGNRLVLDHSRDINLAAAIVLRADIAGRSVAVSIGGESPRDLLVQASLHLERPLGLGSCFYSAFLEVAKPGRARLASRFRSHWGDSAPPSVSSNSRPTSPSHSSPPSGSRKDR